MKANCRHRVEILCEFIKLTAAGTLPRAYAIYGTLAGHRWKPIVWHDMKDTGRKARSGMITFLLTIFVIAVILTISYIVFFLMPGAAPPAG